MGANFEPIGCKIVILLIHLRIQHEQQPTVPKVMHLSRIASFVNPLGRGHLLTRALPLLTCRTSTMSSDSQQKYEAGTHSIAYVTTPNANSAKELARKLVDRKLAACVNIIPGLTSIYEWEGKINEDQEILLMIKTRTARVDELSKFVRENHPYSVAEVISVPIENGNPPYLDWLSKAVTEAKK